MGFRHQSSYYEAERQEELYHSSTGHHGHRHHMGHDHHIGYGHMGHGPHIGGHHMSHHMGHSNQHGCGSGYSADSEYSSYSSINPSHSYGQGNHHNNYAGGGGMMASGYAESSMENSFYSTNNPCTPYNRFY